MSSGNEGQASLEDHGWIYAGNSDKVTIMTDGTVEVTPSDSPVILHQGRYRLWQKPDGGLHLVYQRDDKDEPDHMELPGMMVDLFNKGMSGQLSPMALLTELMKMRDMM